MNRTTSTYRAAIAALLLASAAPAARAQSDQKEWIFASNRYGGSEGIPIVRIDPAAPAAEAVTGVMNLPADGAILDITPIPSSTLPTHLLCASTSGMVRRIPTTFSGVLSEVSVGGTIRGCAWMAPLNCYAVIHDWPGTNSSAALSFVDRDATRIIQYGVCGAQLHTWAKGLAFCWDKGADPVSPADDTYRLFWGDKAPGGTTDSIQMLQLSYGDAVLSDGSDPFNPFDDTLGPPFRSNVWEIQMNMMPWSRYRTVLQVVGCDAPSRLQVDVWHAANGHDYVVAGRARTLPTNPVTYSTDVFAWDGSDFSRPGNVLMNTSPSLLNGSNLSGVVTAAFKAEPNPSMQNIRVMNNYVALVHGDLVTSNGGDRIAFYHLAPAAGSTPVALTAVTFPGSAATPPSLVFPNSTGCRGVMMSYAGDKVYVGSDDGANVAVRYPVVAAAQNLATPTPVNGPINGAAAEAITILTPQEQKVANPPLRFEPFFASVSVVLSNDPVANFDTGKASGVPNPFGGCSAGRKGGAGGVPILALLGVLVLGGRSLRR